MLDSLPYTLPKRVLRTVIPFGHSLSCTRTPLISSHTYQKYFQKPMLSHHLVSTATQYPSSHSWMNLPASTISPDSQSKRSFRILNSAGSLLAETLHGLPLSLPSPRSYFIWLWLLLGLQFLSNFSPFHLLYSSHAGLPYIPQNSQHAPTSVPCPPTSARALLPQLATEPALSLPHIPTQTSPPRGNTTSPDRLSKIIPHLDTLVISDAVSFCLPFVAT